MEDYKTMYEQALERAKKYHEGHTLDVNPQSAMEYVFPVLRENGSEKIRKEIIQFLQLPHPQFVGKRNQEEWIDWLEKQDMERKQLYVRFGDIPSNEKSKIYRGEEEIGYENGVSVYPAFELNGNIVLGLTLPITMTTLYTQQHLLEYDNRPCYLVSGDYVGKGTDGEPLIRNISIIKRLYNYRIKEFENQGEQKPVISDDGLREGIAHFGITQYQIDNWLKKYVDVEKQGEQKTYTLEQAASIFLDVLSNSPYNNKPITDAQVVTKEVLKFLTDSYTYNPNAINEQKSTWNEKIKGLNELETYILSLVPDRPLDAIKVDAKNIRYIINKEQKCVWSEEDEKLLNSIIEDVMPCGECPDYPTDEEREYYYYGNKKVEFLKSLRPQNTTVTDEELAQAKKDAYNDALDKIEYHSDEPTFDDGWSAAIWYLKKKNAQPQNTWKPSDEQMEIIYKYSEQNNYDGSVLTSLYRDLKKLKGGMVMNANEVPEKYQTCHWLWNYRSIGLTKEHIKRLNNAINILESLNEHTDAKSLKETKDKLLEDTPEPKIDKINTNAFIEKAVVWISNNCYIPHATLEDFKNYMKGE